MFIREAYVRRLLKNHLKSHVLVTILSFEKELELSILPKRFGDFCHRMLLCRCVTFFKLRWRQENAPSALKVKVYYLLAGED